MENLGVEDIEENQLHLATAIEGRKEFGRMTLTSEAVTLEPCGKRGGRKAALRC